jgi:hypothetical protein
MRATLFSVLFVLGIAASAFAQALSRVDITEGEFKAGMQPVTTPYATGGPWAGVPARALKPDMTPTVSDFRIRAWVEGDGVRVLVFAVTRKPGSPLGSDDEREVQIASVALTSEQSMEITATEKYNARPITLTALSVRGLVYDAQRMRQAIRERR